VAQEQSSITEVTRRNIMDALRLAKAWWAGLPTWAISWEPPRQGEVG